MNHAKQPILETIHAWRAENPDHPWLAMPEFMRGWMRGIAEDDTHNIGGSKDVWEEIALVAKEVLDETENASSGDERRVGV